MLQSGLQVIAHYQPSGGTVRSPVVCRGFLKLRVVTPSLVVFVGMDAAGEVVAAQLGEEFCERMRLLAGATEAPSQGMPCDGCPGNLFGCHARNEAECHKLLVLVGGSTTCVPGRTLGDLTAHVQLWIQTMAGDATWDVLPVLPAGAVVDKMLPQELRFKNVAFWHRHAASEVLPGVMQRAGLAPEDYRIFISYIRKETTGLAEQLHDALTHAGFAVFVDRFSVPVGVDFQERLMQELTDRGMVLLLHSQGLGTSRWVEDEIATATKYRLGLYVLRLPEVEERAELAPDRSRLITKGEWDAAGDKLKKAALDTIVQEIKQVHHEANQRQRQRLANALVAEVLDPARGTHGCKLREAAGGLFVISRPYTNGGSDEVVLNLTTRPPELRDFHHTHVHGSVSASRLGGIIAPAPFLVAQRQEWFDWLGRQSHLRHLDEGQMRHAVDQIIAGNF